MCEVCTYISVQLQLTHSQVGTYHKMSSSGSASSIAGFSTDRQSSSLEGPARSKSLPPDDNIGRDRRMRELTAPQASIMSATEERDYTNQRFGTRFLRCVTMYVYVPNIYGFTVYVPTVMITICPLISGII